MTKQNRKSQFIIGKDKRGDFFAKFRFPNGRIFDHTEGYRRKLSLLKSLKAMVQDIKQDNYVIEDTTGKQTSA